MTWYTAPTVATILGKEPDDEWQKLVANSTNDDIQRALTACREKYRDRPPNLLQFEALLKPVAATTTAANGPTAFQRLIEYILRYYWHKLTFEQQNHIVYECSGKRRDWCPDSVNAARIPADGESPGYRITLEDVERGHIA